MMLDLFKGMFKSQSRETILQDLSVVKMKGGELPFLFPLSTPTITVKCIPVRCNRDPGEKASQPFLFKMVGVPHMNDFIAMSFGHFNKGTGKAEMRQHTYKIDRVLHKENGIELLIMEELMLMRVLNDN